MKFTANSLLFLLLLVFVFSCKKNEVLPSDALNNQSILIEPLALENNHDPNIIQYCTDLMEISKQISVILNSEENLNSTYLESPSLNSLSTFESVFDDAGFSMNVGMANLMQDVIDLTEDLMDENPYLGNMSQTQLENMLSLVIDDLIEEIDGEEIIGASPNDLCKRRRDKATAKCRAMSLVGFTAVGISGFFSFGVGTLIGSVTVLFSLNECLNSAAMDYKFCLKNIK